MLNRELDAYFDKLNLQAAEQEIKQLEAERSLMTQVNAEIIEKLNATTHALSATQEQLNTATNQIGDLKFELTVEQLRNKTMFGLLVERRAEINQLQAKLDAKEAVHDAKHSMRKRDSSSPLIQHSSFGASKRPRREAALNADALIDHMNNEWKTPGSP